MNALGDATLAFENELAAMRQKIVQRNWWNIAQRFEISIVTDMAWKPEHEVYQRCAAWHPIRLAVAKAHCVIVGRRPNHPCAFLYASRAKRVRDFLGNARRPESEAKIDPRSGLGPGKCYRPLNDRRDNLILNIMHFCQLT